jgi:hypothetical protein
MRSHRHVAITIVPLAVLLAGLLGACTTAHAVGRLGEASGPAPAMTPAPPTVPASSSTRGTSTDQATHTPTHTPTHTRTSSPSPSPLSSDPGDYSVAVANAGGVHECGWKDNGDGSYQIYAYFGIYYVGPQHPKTVAYKVDLAGASTIVKGSTAPGTDGPFGVPVPDTHQIGMTTLRLRLDLGFQDDRPGSYAVGGDDDADITFIIPNGLPPAGGTPTDFAC